MVRPRGEINAVCQNEICNYYLKEESKDIIKRGKYSTGNQRYFCNHCKTFFMETKGLGGCDQMRDKSRVGPQQPRTGRMRPVNGRDHRHQRDAGGLWIRKDAVICRLLWSTGT